jgi:excisionase family DNA binding protein
MSRLKRNRPDTSPRPIESLESLKRPYVTVPELASYWGVSSKHLYKQINAGTLPAIRLGPRLVRIRTSEALKFEHVAKMTAAESTDTAQPAEGSVRRSSRSS